MKKVIFVGGASYCGSTFFDMILANDPKGFSCGEVSALFWPFRKSHIEFRRKIDEKNKVWSDIIENGEEKIYQTIFSMFPNVDYVVDSSKNPLWIKRQMEYLKNTSIRTKSIVIWKTPIEAAASFDKRMRIDDFEKVWTNYHRLFFTVVNEFKAVKYREFVEQKKMLNKICKYLELYYYDGKEKYWNKKHYTLFGNTSAKIHIQSKKDNRYKKMKKYLVDRINATEENLENDYQKIYYKGISEDLMDDHQKEAYIKKDKITKVCKVLIHNDIQENRKKDYEEYKRLVDSLKYRKITINMKSIKQNVRSYLIKHDKVFN